MAWNIERIFFFFFSIQNVKSSFSIIFLKIFPISFSWMLICSFQIVFIYYRFNFCIFFLNLYQFLHVLSMCYIILKAFIIILLIGFIIVFCFLSNPENLYIIQQDLNLFYDIFRITNDDDQRWNCYIYIYKLLIFTFRKKWMKTFLNKFITFINHDFYVITLNILNALHQCL